MKYEYITPQILILEMDSEEVIAGSNDTPDYGGTGGIGDESETKSRSNLLPVIPTDDDWDQ